MECNRIEGAAVKHIANHLADVGRFLISPQLHRKCLPNSGEKGRAVPFYFIRARWKSPRIPFTLWRLKVTQQYAICTCLCLTVGSLIKSHASYFTFIQSQVLSAWQRHGIMSPDWERHESDCTVCACMTSAQHEPYDNKMEPLTCSVSMQIEQMPHPSAWQIATKVGLWAFNFSMASIIHTEKSFVVEWQLRCTIHSAQHWTSCVFLVFSLIQT